MKNNIKDVWANSPCDTFRYCELAKEQKRPIHKNWQTDTKSFDEVWNAHQANRSNIGLVLGYISGVMDIDCDSVEAVALMHHLANGYNSAFPLVMVPRCSTDLLLGRTISRVPIELLN